MTGLIAPENQQYFLEKFDITYPELWEWVEKNSVPSDDEDHSDTIGFLVYLGYCMYHSMTKENPRTLTEIYDIIHLNRPLNDS